MDTQTLAIILIVGLVLFIMILKYVLRAAANKGMNYDFRAFWLEFWFFLK